MVQFYFLSILLNVVAGLALLVKKPEPKGTKLDGLKILLDDHIVRLVTGVLGGTVGFLKLLTVMRGDLPVIGDLVPAATGLASGFTLVLEFYKSNATVQSTALERLDRLFITNRKLVGGAAIMAGIVHFLFPSVLFL